MDFENGHTNQGERNLRALGASWPATPGPSGSGVTTRPFLARSCRSPRSKLRPLSGYSGREMLAVRLSHFDPKRPIGTQVCCDAQRSSRVVVCDPGLRGTHETARVHHPARRHGRLAARGERAAAGDACSSGFMSARFAREILCKNLIDAFHKGLGEGGFPSSTATRRSNIAGLAGGLRAAAGTRSPNSWQQRVNVLVATGGGCFAALAAKAATATNPGCLQSMTQRSGQGRTGRKLQSAGRQRRPDALTLTKSMAPKRFDLLREIVPRRHTLRRHHQSELPGCSPANCGMSKRLRHRLAKRVFAGKGQQRTPNWTLPLQRFFGERRSARLLVASDPYFRHARAAGLSPSLRSNRLSGHLPVPPVCVCEGGLISYGPSITDAYRQIGVYTARILKGAAPADLPVMQPTKFDFIINLKTAKALRLEIPPTVSARADEVIE